MKDNQDIEIEQMVRNRPQPTPVNLELQQQKLKKSKARKRWHVMAQILGTANGAVAAIAAYLILNGGGLTALYVVITSWALYAITMLCLFKSWRR